MISRTRVVLDASVLVAAAGSPTGGSAAAITLLTQSQEFQAVVSEDVLREALGNLRLKFERAAVLRFSTLLGALRPDVVDPGEALTHSDLPDFVAAKDEHVLRACLAANAAICLTLDRRHLLTDDMRRWGMQRQLRFLSPGEFLAWERLRSDEGR